MSLSDPRVIDTLNRYFVPVYLSNADYAPKGSATPEEKRERQRIFQQGYDKKLSVGTVHAYVISPDGELLDTRHVAQAAKAAEMLALLNGAVEKLGTKPGKPVVAPAPQSKLACQPGKLTLHLVSRYLRKTPDGYALVQNNGGDWDAIPGEDWIELDQEKWSKLLPAGAATAGTSWELDPGVSAFVLRYFYPPTENNSVNRDKLEEASLRATVGSVKDGVAHAAIAGSVQLHHTFYYKEDGKQVRASVVGVLEFELGTRKVRSLRLVTDTASYGTAGMAGTPFGVAVRTVCAP